MLVLACALTKLPNPSSAYGDYDDSEDDFWKDSAPKSQPKEVRGREGAAALGGQA